MQRLRRAPLVFVNPQEFTRIAGRARVESLLHEHPILPVFWRTRYLDLFWAGVAFPPAPLSMAAERAQQSAERVPGQPSNPANRSESFRPASQDRSAARR